MGSFSVKTQNLFDALYMGDNEKIHSLVQTGIDIDEADPDHGLTALHMAARYGNIYVLEVLLSNPDVRVDRYDRYFRFPLDLARQFKKTTAAGLIVDHIYNNKCKYRDYLRTYKL